jgi:hypothetical protein
MQGTVWGSLMCTATMDKLGKLFYKNDNLLYQYKGVGGTTSYEILCVQKCSEIAMEVNSVINAFIESKKLNLSSKKCHRINGSKKKENSLKYTIQLQFQF